MKRMFLIIGCIVLIFSSVLAYEGQGNELTVTVTGIEEITGQISIGLYFSEEDWPDTGKSDSGVNLIIKGDTISYTFQDIQSGTYAVAIFHDADMNFTLDRGLFGIPKEGYAFSNNIFGLFGPPKFKDASFQVDGKTEVQIEVKY